MYYLGFVLELEEPTLVLRSKPNNQLNVFDRMDSIAE
jgi:hypothetical protein